MKWSRRQDDTDGQGANPTLGTRGLLAAPHLQVTFCSPKTSTCVTSFAQSSLVRGGKDRIHLGKAQQQG